MNTPVNGQLVATDPEGSSVTFSLGKGRRAKRGTVVVLPNGQFTYTPESGFIGTDSFTFQASDGTASATGTATITVGPLRRKRNMNRR